MDEMEGHDVKQNKPGIGRQILMDSYEEYKNIILVRNTDWGVGKMAQWVEVFTSMSDSLS